MQLTIEVPDVFEIGAVRWKPVALRAPKEGEYCLSADGRYVFQAGYDYPVYDLRIIVERIPSPVWPKELPKRGWLLGGHGGEIFWSVDKHDGWEERGQYWRKAGPYVGSGFIKFMWPNITLPRLQPGEMMAAPGGDQ